MLMKLNNLSQFALIALLALPLRSAQGQSPVAPATPAPAVAPAPNNNSVVSTANLPANVAEVVKLSSAGLGNDVVLAFVNSSHSMFNLSADNIVQLKDLGVSPTIITAMLNRDNYLQNPNGPGQTVYNNQAPPPANPAPTGQPGMQPDNSYAEQIQVQPPLAAPPPVDYGVVSPGPDYYYGGAPYPYPYWGWDPGWVWFGGGWRWGGGGGFRGGGFRDGGFRGGGFHGGGGFRGGGGGHGGHH